MHLKWKGNSGFLRSGGFSAWANSFVTSTHLQMFWTSKGSPLSHSQVVYTSPAPVVEQYISKHIHERIRNPLTWTHLDDLSTRNVPHYTPEKSRLWKWRGTWTSNTRIFGHRIRWLYHSSSSFPDPAGTSKDTKGVMGPIYYWINDIIAPGFFFNLAGRHVCRARYPVPKHMTVYLGIQKSQFRDLYS